MKWLQTTAEKHGVNPIIFGLLYFGTIPSYAYGMARFITSYKTGWLDSILWFLVGFTSFAAPYLYVLIWGRNLSRRFYTFLLGWIAVAVTMAVIKTIQQFS